MDNQDDMESLDTDLKARLHRLERSHRGGRWWRRATLALVMALVLAPLAADALGPVPHTFSSGGVISASEMNANFAYLQNAITDVEGAVPTGAVMLFNLSTCPAGWSEVTDARGRALVGMNGSAGTLGGTLGTPLSDLENRSHTHSTDVGSTTTSSGGSHNHQWLRDGAATYGPTGANVTVGGVPLQAFTSGTPLHMTNLRQSGSADYHTSSAGAHTHTVNPPATTSTGATTSQVMPYIQYLACQRD